LGTPDEGPSERIFRAANAVRPTELDVEAMERVFPQLVITGDDGEKTVAYEGLIGVLIEAVKELDARLSVLETADEARGSERQPPRPGPQD
jgi:hypothetical protein